MPTTLKDLEITYDKPNWCPGCVLGTTYIQTNPSAKVITDLKKGGKVIGSDGKAHEITEYLEHTHDGSVYRLQTKYFGETTLTPEHPVLAVRRTHSHNTNKEFKSEWIEASELKKGDYLLYPILKDERDTETIDLTYVKKHKDTRSKALPKEISLTPELIRLFGYYLAEGHVHRRAINFTFHAKEDRYADDVMQVMQQTFGLTSKKSYRLNKQTIDLSFNSSYLSEIFETWFGYGAVNKRIPDFLMFLPKDRQTELLKGMWRGDGWVSKKTHRANYKRSLKTAFESKAYKLVYKTISKILCEQVKMLLLRQGILPTISVNKAYGIHKVAYAIQVIDPHDFSLLNVILGSNSDSRIEKRNGFWTSQNDGTHRGRDLITRDFAFLPLRKIEEKPYKGVVHNLGVDTENCYVTENAILHNCGDFGMWVSLKNAIVQLNLNPWEVVLISGIGCSSKLPYWVKTYGFNGLHGRPMPVAEAIKLANHGLTVIVIGGDGDQYGEGGNHLIHAMRRNIDLTLIVHNNQIYGLTTGQYSPTTDIGIKNKATPDPTVEVPINSMSLALAAGATYVARGFAGDVKLETQLLVEAVKHKGFAIVDSMQPCVTFNQKNTFAWFYEHTYKLADQGHDPTNKMQAFQRAEEWPLRHALKEGEKEKVALGLFFKEDRPTWHEQIPEIAQVPLVKHPIDNVNVDKLFEELV